MDPESLGPLFVHPSEPNRLYLITLFLSSVTIVVAGIALIRGRVPLAIRSSALLLIPIFAYVLGNLQILEDSKRVEFCGSCHGSMSPVVEAMREHETSLAGIHYQKGAVSYEQACFSCHSGYGIWGNFNAKVRKKENKETENMAIARKQGDPIPTKQIMLFLLIFGAVSAILYTYLNYILTDDEDDDLHLAATTPAPSAAAG